MLADCLAARLPGTLEEIEQVVRAVESAPSLEGAADRLRPEIELPGAVRWTARRVRGVHRGLRALRGLLPQTLDSVPVTLTAFAKRLGVGAVLPALRAIAANYLAHLPPPLGFHHRRGAGGDLILALQQPMGPDPPAGHG